MRSLLRSLSLLLWVSVFCASGHTQVIKGSAPAPAGSTILLPEDSFPGGVLTGVVIGPDDKPVANAQVNLDAGVPITLAGEVVGDEQPQKPQPEQAQRPQPDHPTIQKPQDCAAALKEFAGLAGQVPPAPAGGAPAGDLAGHGTGGGEGRGVLTDANGRFALCVPADSKGVNVSLGDGSVHTSVPASPQFPPDPCAQAGRFFQPGARLSLCQRIRKPALTQGGKTWDLLSVFAMSPGGDHVLTSLRLPHDLQPGPATLRFVNGDGQPQQLAGRTFKILSARMDRAQLHSHQGADFEYTAQFGDGSVHPCVHVTVAGPVMLVQAPPPQIKVDASGVGHFGGKIRATQVAPGSTVPFDINPTITECGVSPGPVQTGEVNPGPVNQPGEKDPGPIQQGEKNPGPTGMPGEKNPGPPGSPSDSEMKLSLTPAPVVVNPFVPQDNRGKAPAPQQVAMTPPAPGNIGPEHTMGATDKYAKAPAPISSCNFQNKTPVINGVFGVKQPTVFTQENGLNYFTIQGCNFGTTGGHVYLMLRKGEGIGFPNQVELYLMSGNNPWQDKTLNVYVPPSLSGYLDQNGVVLRVVTAKGLTAERDKQVFHAERVASTMLWMPRSQVQLGDTNPWLTPTFTSSPPSSTLIIADGDGCSSGTSSRTNPYTAGVDRSISNVGSPFTAKDDLWDFSKMRPGFDVAYATPSYDNWDGAGCSQTSGKWGTYWDSATSLRVHVQGCYHSGTGNFRSSNAHYALQVCARGPKGVQPWPDGMK